MSEWQKMIFGNESVEKRETFEKRLGDIQEKYKYWFEKRPGMFESQKHDMLSNHTLMTWDLDKTTFGFHKNSDLPKMIMDDCIHQFNEVYK